MLRFYTLLEVTESASAEELKKAYRRLAMKWHPDRNPGNAQAGDYFREISFAYKILSDPKLRELYHQEGENFKEVTSEEAINIFHEVFGKAGTFEDFFGSRTQKGKHPQAGEDIKCPITITLEENITGCERQVELERLVTCEDCHGTGRTEKSQESPCGVCSGRGSVIASIGATLAHNCPNCGGGGTIITHPCKKCRGHGTLREKKMVTLKIPPGAITGTRLRNTGGGDVGKYGGKAGNLFICIEFEPHTIYQIDGSNLLCTVAIPFETAVLGGQIALPTLRGETRFIEIPMGTQGGSKIVVEEEGLRTLTSEKQGNVIIRVEIKVPVDLNPTQKKALRHFVETLKPKESENENKPSAA